MKSFFLDDKFRIDRPGLFGRRVSGNSYWSPADEIASGNYAWEWSAKTAPTMPGGVTTLLDANGGPITLTTSSNAPTDQPAYLADAGDGAPALEFTSTTAEQKVAYVAPLEIHTETLFYLLRPTQGGATAGSGLLAMGDTTTGFQVDARQAGAVQGRIVGSGRFGNAIPAAPVDFTNQWMCGVIELDPAAGQLRHYVNGSLYATGTYNGAAPFSVAHWAVGTNRALGGKVPQQFAAGFVLHSVGDETRARGIDYLKREWGARVTGW